ncbi:alpha-ribazole phosphatase [Desulfuromonas sp. CSMB_57]|jgi:alpha-ribazole phosphatase/probable phosphoglycerate mutase|uniref:alpha-ribazole phosphatase n=1 Tax=Desulfuromonas sp. CSMB_57 TaxID=2807629 RepID=UPI001CD28593|nr:alpha-ribazole phosphatase [Desulfuromonas sp. CSMB_57]
MGTPCARIHLVRHGQVAGFEEKRYNGQSEVPLTALGWEQYRLLQERLRPRAVSAVYSSDLERCLAGARLLAAGYGLEAVALPALRELHIGRWAGRTWTELQRRYPRQWRARLADLVHYRPPGGESLLDVAQRIRPVLQKIWQRHLGAEIVLVAHGAVNRIILLDALCAPLASAFRLEQDYGCHNIIDYFPDGRCLVRLLNG